MTRSASPTDSRIPSRIEAGAAPPSGAEVTVFREGKMRINKTPWVILGTVLLALCACSRQQSDWQKTREANTADSYELFVKKYPSGEFTARRRPGSRSCTKSAIGKRPAMPIPRMRTASLHQAISRGQRTEEARIRVENFTLAQTPTGPNSPAVAGAAPPAAGSAAEAQTPPAALPPSKPAPQPPRTSTAPPAAAKPAAPAAKLESGTYAIQLGAFRSGLRRPTSVGCGCASSIRSCWPDFHRRSCQKDRDGNALSAAGRRNDRGARTQSLQGSQGQIAALRGGSSAARLSAATLGAHRRNGRTASLR